MVGFMLECRAVVSCYFMSWLMSEFRSVRIRSRGLVADAVVLKRFPLKYPSLRVSMSIFLNVLIIQNYEILPFMLTPHLRRMLTAFFPFLFEIGIWNVRW